MQEEIRDVDAEKARSAENLRHILTITFSLTICVLIGVAYIYI